MFFHASQTADLTELLPKISNHHLPLVYLTSKRENSLVYLSNAVEIDYCEFVEDAYDAIINAANEKKLLIRTFEEQCQEALNWSKTTIQNEYQNAKEQPEYRLFLKAKFSDILP